MVHETILGLKFKFDLILKNSSYQSVSEFTTSKFHRNIEVTCCLFQHIQLVD